MKFSRPKNYKFDFYHILVHVSVKVTQPLWFVFQDGVTEVAPQVYDGNPVNNDLACLFLLSEIVTLWELQMTESASVEFDEINHLRLLFIDD